MTRECINPSDHLSRARGGVVSFSKTRRADERDAATLTVSQRESRAREMLSTMR